MTGIEALFLCHTIKKFHRIEVFNEGCYAFRYKKEFFN